MNRVLCGSAWVRIVFRSNTTEGSRRDYVGKFDRISLSFNCAAPASFTTPDQWYDRGSVHILLFLLFATKLVGTVLGARNLSRGSSRTGFGRYSNVRHFFHRVGHKNHLDKVALVWVLIRLLAMCQNPNPRFLALQLSLSNEREDTTVISSLPKVR